MNRKPQDETEEISEEGEYANVPVRAVDKGAASPDQRCLFFTRSLPLIAVCWLILLLIMGLRIYFTSVISEHNAKLTAENQQLKTERNNYTTLLAANRNLTNLNDKLSLDNDNLRRQRNNLTVQLGKLPEQIQTMETNWNELNVSRAQWSIDTYCRKDKAEVRQCTACLKGWYLTNSSCYVTRNTPPPQQITWERARANCRGDHADLSVVHNQLEKDIVNRYSWDMSGGVGYWIGLRVEGGKWKWIDGTELNETSWIGAPTEGHCGVSVQNQDWTSVMCDEKKRWICKQEALIV